MQFILDGDIYKIARITGPKHNLLGVRFSETIDKVETILLPTKDGEPQNIEPQDVLREVEEGLNIVNLELNKQYFVSEIYYIPSDTKPVSVYSFLIQELIKRINDGGEFITV